MASKRPSETAPKKKKQAKLVDLFRRTAEKQQESEICVENVPEQSTSSTPHDVAPSEPDTVFLDETLSSEDVVALDDSQEISDDQEQEIHHVQHMASSDTEQLLDETEEQPGSANIQHRFRVKTIHELLTERDEWSGQKSSAKDLGRTATLRWKQGFNKDWLKSFPWVETIMDDKNNVIGAVCSECRLAFQQMSEHDAQQEKRLSKETWINKPFTNWGRFTEQAWLHCFGKTEKSGEWRKKGGAKALQKAAIAGSIQISTPHMKRLLDRIEKEKRTVASASVDTLLGLGKYSKDGTMNFKTIEGLIKLTYYCLKKKVAVHTNLVDLVNIFQEYKVDEFERIKKLPNYAMYTSSTAISSFIDAIYYSILLGIYEEVANGQPVSENPRFSLLLDAGSTSNIREYVAVVIKYVTDEVKAMERVINVEKTAHKDGAALEQIVLDTLLKFNTEVSALGEKLDWDISGNFGLDAKYMEGFGSDGGGGCRSKYISCNQRVKKHNPRNIDIHCISHVTQLAIKSASTGSTLLKKYLDITTKLQELFSTSARLGEIFKNAQNVTGEGKNFRPGNVTLESDRPMHRWESEKRLIEKLIKLPLSMEYALAAVKNTANNPDVRSFNSHYLYNNVVTPEFILYLGVKLDILEILINFVKKTQGQIDYCAYLRAVDKVKSGLKKLTTTDGASYKHAKQLLQTACSDWCGDDGFDERNAITMRDEIIGVYATDFEERHSTETLKSLKGFDFFNMQTFRLLVTTAAEIDDYGEEEQDILIKHFCQPVEFVAKWPEEKDKKFYSSPLGPEEQLIEELTQYKEYVFKYFIHTGKSLTTHEVISRMLQANLPFLDDRSILRQILIIFLSLPLSTADVERAMSVLKLVNSPLCRAQTAETVSKLVIIKKEGAKIEDFDTKFATTVWYHLKPRRIQLAITSKNPTPGKSLLLKVHSSEQDSDDETEVQTVDDDDL